MGVGGLLMENCHPRPQPRTVADLEANRNVTGNRACRRTLDADGRPQQAAAEIDGKKLCGSSPNRRWPPGRPASIVVTGHQADLVEQALAGLNVKFVRNPDFAAGWRPPSRPAYQRCLKMPTARSSASATAIGLL